MSTALRLADRWFRACCVLTLLALAATGLSLASDRGAWRVPFVLAHLAALLALTPLGLVLLVEGVRDARSPAEVVRRHRPAVLLLALLALTVAVSLANQEGARWLRASANLASVAIVVTLVVRYLRWSRKVGVADAPRVAVR